jgi:serine/threonine protein kinase
MSKADEKKPGAPDRLPIPEGELLTAQDIFGDILDGLGVAAAPPPAAAAPVPPGAPSGPIRVKVGEPAAALAAAALAAQTRPTAAPEDVAAVLDVLSESATPPPPPAGLGAAAPEPPAEKHPPRSPLSSLGEGGRLDIDAMIEALRPRPGAPPPRPAVATPQAQAPPSREDRTAALVDLPALFGAPGPAEPKPTARSGVRFQAASSGGAEPALDLGALAEAAFEEGAGSADQGQAYGAYELLERIATGGMAEVFKAKRRGVAGFEKVVAVKRILPQFSDNPEFVEMFVNEAKMVAGLEHPNIVQIHDLGAVDRTYYIAMEYVQGRDVRTILRRARERGLAVPVDLSAFVVSQVARALDFAHRKRDERGRPVMVVHRDVSPQNILISFEGDVKLTDFGIAKAASKANVTEAGALRGKLVYMSPEQAWGRPVDRRSDVFSLGLVFYEMVTGRKPFTADTEVAIIETARRCQIDPPGEALGPARDRLEPILMKALRPAPEDRPQDAGELAESLEAVLRDQIPAPGPALLGRFLTALFAEAPASPGLADSAEAPPLGQDEGGGDRAGPLGRLWRKIGFG